MEHLKQLVVTTLKGIAKSLQGLSQPKHESTSKAKQGVEIALNVSLSFKTDRLKLISELIDEMVVDNTLHHFTTFTVGDKQVKYDVLEMNNILDELRSCIQHLITNKTVDKVGVNLIRGYVEKEMYVIPDLLGVNDFVVILSERIQSSKLFIFSIRKNEQVWV